MKRNDVSEICIERLLTQFDRFITFYFLLIRFQGTNHILYYVHPISVSSSGTWSFTQLKVIVDDCGLDFFEATEGSRPHFHGLSFHPAKGRTVDHKARRFTTGPPRFTPNCD